MAMTLKGRKEAIVLLLTVEFLLIYTTAKKKDFYFQVVYSWTVTQYMKPRNPA